MFVVMRMGTGHEGIDALQPLKRAKFDQLVERAIGLIGVAQPRIPQSVQQIIGTVSRSNTSDWFRVKS